MMKLPAILPFEAIMSDRQFLISTTFAKIGDEPTALNFRVECREEDIDEAGPTPVEAIGVLEGFLAQPGYLPEDFDDGWYSDLFDSRSGHADEAFSVLVSRRRLIKRAIGTVDDLDFCGAIALLERVWVSPEFRGRGLALRLMREAKHLLGRPGLLAVLKAHPDGENITSKACLDLAGYYQSDANLGLQAISERALPIWLVASWSEPDATQGDSHHRSE